MKERQAFLLFQGKGENVVKKPKLDNQLHTKIETATFAMGWFWGSDALYGSLEGVISTQVGYAGGSTEKPTYHNIGDHSETVKVLYDPELISYEELLKEFLRNHDPFHVSFSRQYRSAIFYHDELQKAQALEYIEALEWKTKKKVMVSVEEAGPFYPAEGYHQKYYLQMHEDIMAEFRKIYPSFQDIVNSTAAARVNGYLGGYGLNKHPLSDKELGKIIQEIIAGN